MEFSNNGGRGPGLFGPAGYPTMRGTTEGASTPATAQAFAQAQAPLDQQDLTPDLATVETERDRLDKAVIAIGFRKKLGVDQTEALRKQAAQALAEQHRAGNPTAVRDIVTGLLAEDVQDIDQGKSTGDKEMDARLNAMRAEQTQQGFALPEGIYRQAMQDATDLQNPQGFVVTDQGGLPIRLPLYPGMEGKIEPYLTNKQAVDGGYEASITTPVETQFMQQAAAENGYTPDKSPVAWADQMRREGERKMAVASGEAPTKDGLWSKAFDKSNQWLRDLDPGIFNDEIYRDDAWILMNANAAAQGDEQAKQALEKVGLGRELSAYVQGGEYPLAIAGMATRKSFAALGQLAKVLQNSPRIGAAAQRLLAVAKPSAFRYAGEIASTTANAADLGLAIPSMSSDGRDLANPIAMGLAALGAKGLHSDLAAIKKLPETMAMEDAIARLRAMPAIGEVDGPMAERIARAENGLAPEKLEAPQPELKQLPNNAEPQPRAEVVPEPGPSPEFLAKNRGFIAPGPARADDIEFSNAPLRQLTTDRGTMMREAAEAQADPMIAHRLAATEQEFLSSGVRAEAVFKDLVKAIGSGGADRVKNLDEVLEYMRLKQLLQMNKAKPGMEWPAGLDFIKARTRAREIADARPNLDAEMKAVSSRLASYADEIGDARLKKLFAKGWLPKSVRTEEPLSGIADLGPQPKQDMVRGTGQGTTKTDEDIIWGQSQTESLRNALVRAAQHKAATKAESVLADMTGNTKWSRNVSPDAEARAKALADARRVEGELAQAKVTETRDKLERIKAKAKALGKGVKLEQAKAKVAQSVAQTKLRNAIDKTGDITQTAAWRSHEKAITDYFKSKSGTRVSPPMKRTIPAGGKLDRAQVRVQNKERVLEKARARQEERALARAKEWDRNQAIQSFKQAVHDRAVELGYKNPTDADLAKVRADEFEPLRGYEGGAEFPTWLVSRKGFTDLFNKSPAETSRFADWLRGSQQAFVFTAADPITAAAVSTMYNAAAHASRLGAMDAIGATFKLGQVMVSDLRRILGGDWAKLVQEYKTRGLAHDPYAGKIGNADNLRYRDWALGVDEAIAKKDPTHILKTMMMALPWAVPVVAKYLNGLVRPLSHMMNKAVSNQIYAKNLAKYEKLFGFEANDMEKAILRASADIESTRHMDESRRAAESPKVTGARSAAAKAVNWLSQWMAFARPQFMDMITIGGDALSDKKRLGKLASYLAAAGAFWLFTEMGDEEDAAKLSPQQRIQGSYSTGIGEDGIESVWRNPLAVTGTFSQVQRGLLFAGEALANGNERLAKQYILEATLAVVPSAKISEGFWSAMENPFQKHVGSESLITAVSAFAPTAGLAAKAFDQAPDSEFAQPGLYDAEADTYYNKAGRAALALVGLGKNTFGGDIVSSIASGEAQGRFARSGKDVVMRPREIQYSNLAQTKDIRKKLADFGEEYRKEEKQEIARINAEYPEADQKKVKQYVGKVMVRRYGPILKQEIPQAAYNVVAKAQGLPQQDWQDFKPSNPKEVAAVKAMDKLVNNWTKIARADPSQ